MNIVITGASKGIGRAIAEKFFREGHQIAICARGREALLSLQSELQSIKSDSTILAIECDVSDKKSLENFCSEILTHWETIDVLINNAGVFIPGTLQDEEEGILEFLMKTNVYSAYYCTRKFLPAIRKSPQPYIFNICSVASIKAYPNGGSYAITKAALLAFSSNLREETKNNNLKVISVLPGATYTASWAGVEIPEERFIPAEDIATLIYTCTQLNPSTVVEEIIIRPQEGDL